MIRHGVRHQPEGRLGGDRQRPPGAARPTGERRKAATRGRVQEAITRLLTAGGYEHLTYERVAAESGVAKTTLYRHWPSKAELVFDLVLRERELPSLAATGSAAGDVAALADRLAEFVGGAAVQPVLAGVLADLVADPVLRQRFQADFVVAAQPVLEEALARVGRARGVSSPLTTSDLQAVLLGSAFFWTYLDGRTVDEVRSRIASLIEALYCRR